MISESDTLIHFYEIRAHTGAVGNEFAEAITTHAALQYYGHNEAFPPPSPEGNPISPRRGAKSSHEQEPETWRC